jgi:hypothetical protein
LRHSFKELFKAATIGLGWMLFGEAVKFPALTGFFQAEIFAT